MRLGTRLDQARAERVRALAPIAAAVEAFARETGFASPIEALNSFADPGAAEAFKPYLEKAVAAGAVDPAALVAAVDNAAQVEAEYESARTNAHVQLIERHHDLAFNLDPLERERAYLDAAEAAAREGDPDSGLSRIVAKVSARMSPNDPRLEGSLEIISAREHEAEAARKAPAEDRPGDPVEAWSAAKSDSWLRKHVPEIDPNAGATVIVGAAEEIPGIAEMRAENEAAAREAEAKERARGESSYSKFFPND